MQSRDDTEERKVSIQFTAFGGRAKYASLARKGDQLIVTARIENNNFIDGQGQKRYEMAFIVTDVEYGAQGAETREYFSNKAAGNK